MNIFQGFAQIFSRGEIFKEFFHSVEAAIDCGNIDERTFEPMSQQPISERSFGKVERVEERTFLGAVAQISDDFEIF